MVNLLDGKTLKTVGLVFKTHEVIKSKVGTTLDDYVNNSNNIIGKLNEEIIKPILSQGTEKRSAKPSSSRFDDPLLVRPVVPPMYQDRDPLRNIHDPLRDIGRGDLDPFGRGGGMIFQPNLPFDPLRPIRPPA